MNTSTCAELGAACCYNDENGAWCDGGLIPNSSNPSDCNCRLRYTECSPGEKSCDGKATQICNSSGKWSPLSQCSNRCFEGACIDNLADGQICAYNADCESGNCQVGPGTKFCAPAGQSIGVVKAGETCGTTSYDRTCEDGYVCSSNRCKASNGRECGANADCVSNYCLNNICSVKQEEKLLEGLACETDNQCLSGKCEVTEFGWKACAVVAYLVDAGYQCGTTEFNQECKAPYQCLNYICRVPVEIVTPMEKYLQENAGLLSSESETPGWGEASEYLAVSALNTVYNVTDTIITNPGGTGKGMAQGMADHFSGLWDQALCADYRYAQSDTCKNLTWYEKSYVAANLVTLGGFESLVSLYNSSGKDAMMNVNNYAWNDPRRWIDNAELGIAVAGFADSVASPFINPFSVADAPVSSTYQILNDVNKNTVFDSIFANAYDPRAKITFDNGAWINGQYVEKIVEINPYQDLLVKAQNGVANGLSPEKAVQEAMIVSSGRSSSGLSETVLGPLTGKTTLAQQVCIGQANCVGQALVGQALLEDLGTASQVIYGTGGSFPYIHAALETQEGILPYGSRGVFNLEQFDVLAKRFQWGNYTLEGLAQ